MDRIDSLFEEDIQMQDSLEDIETLTNDAEDAVLLATNERYDMIEAKKPRLFTNHEAATLNEDGLTPEEELEIDAALLDMDPEDLADDDDADLLDDELGI